MPAVFETKCNSCDFKLPTGWGGYMYVTDGDGQRIVCPHPCESIVVERVLKASNPEVIPEWQSYMSLTYGIRTKWKILKFRLFGSLRPLDIGELSKQRTGFNYYCVCHSCLQQMEIDIKRDLRECHGCGSIQVSTVQELIGKPCPQCHGGKIVEKCLGKS